MILASLQLPNRKFMINICTINANTITDEDEMMIIELVYKAAHLVRRKSNQYRKKVLGFAFHAYFKNDSKFDLLLESNWREFANYVMTLKIPSDLDGAIAYNKTPLIEVEKIIEVKEVIRRVKVTKQVIVKEKPSTPICIHWKRPRTKLNDRISVQTRNDPNGAVVCLDSINWSNVLYIAEDPSNGNITLHFMGGGSTTIQISTSKRQYNALVAYAQNCMMHLNDGHLLHPQESYKVTL